MRMFRGPVKLTAPFVLAAVIGGCVCQPPKYRASLDELVDKHNANASAVPRLWARATIELHLVGEDGTMHWGSMLSAPNGLLMMSKGPDPLGSHDFLLIGRELGREIFRLGNSLADEQYYYWYSVGDNAGGAFGQTNLAGAPGIQGMPINPLQLLAVLAVGELPSDFTSLPTVALAFDETNSCNRSYVLHCIGRRALSGRIELDKLIRMPWNDDIEPRPRRIDFLDDRGITRISATLDDWRTVDMSDADHAGPPAMMPTQVYVEWLDTGSYLRIRLSEMTTAEKFDIEAFALWDRLPAGFPPEAMTQVDAALGGDRTK